MTPRHLSRSIPPRAGSGEASPRRSFDPPRRIFELLLVLLLCWCLADAPFARRDPVNEYTQVFNKAAANWKAQRYKEYIEGSKTLLPLAEATRDPRRQAESLIYVARAYLLLRDAPKATACLDKSLQLSQKLGDLRLQAFADYLKGILSTNQDKPREAMTFFQQADRLAQAAGDIERQAWTALKSGEALWLKLNDYSKAGHNFARALQLFQQLNDSAGITYSLRSAGAIFAIAGEVDKAIDYYQRALEQTKAPRTQEAILGSLGNAYALKRDYKTALGYYRQALEFGEKDPAKTNLSVALGIVGQTYLKIGDLKSAEQYINKALRVAKATANKQAEAFSLKDVGDLYFKLNRLDEAEKRYQAALKLGQDLGYEDIQWEVYEALGDLSQARGQDEKAHQYYQNAIELIERVTKRLTIRERSGFLDQQLHAYEKLVALLLARHARQPQNGYHRLAFLYSEKARAQSMLELVLRSRLLESLPIDQRLKERLDELRIGLKDRYQQLAQARQQLASLKAAKRNPSDLPQRIADLQIQIAKAEEELSAIFTQIRDKNPPLADLYQPQVLTAEQARAVIPAGEALIEYFVTDKNTIGFLLTRDRFVFEELAIGRTELRDLLQQASPLFSQNRQPVGPGGEGADFGLDKLHRLYQLLFQPLEKHLPPETPLTIVRHDALNYLPFEMLVTGWDPKANTQEYLIQRYPISYLHSASLLAEQVRETPDKWDTRSPRRAFGLGDADIDLLAVGNPDFARAPSGADATDLLASNRGAFVPLPYAEQEVAQISRFVKVSRLLTHSQATEKRFKELAPRARIIHIASHNALDKLNPMQSKIVFATDPRIDQQGEDGYLHAFEVFNLALHAQLVVLSACETEAGRLRPGEGLESISRAFLCAGVPALLATHWPIADGTPTIALQRTFYQLLTQGLDKRAALRKAKLALLGHKEHGDPFFWAPFVLIGDCSPIDIEKVPIWLAVFRMEPLQAARIVGIILSSAAVVLSLWSWYKDKRKRRNRCAAATKTAAP